ncbi:hypothetical protein C5Y41_03920 [Rahnella variigena]|uniref:ABC-three component system protein n=1 Tax=Rahnella variigena TaxID=574964 RepID=UPI00101CE569|nr:ABC-three component system protein [Rahnella variigena]RYJ16442.1 hypothetical protein C5Y41_03920 [Rahnella variigena]
MDHSSFRDFTVKVNNGSGVIFMVSSSEYCYVLTAKHNIFSNNELSITRTLLDVNGHLFIETLNVIGEPYCHSDENKDAAIIKVRKVNLNDVIYRIDNLQESDFEFHLCGFPLVRTGSDGFRINKVNPLHQKIHGYIEGELIPTALQDEIIGQSGGGILSKTGESYFLLGVQKGMAAQDDIETLSRVTFMPLTFFDEIVNENSHALISLLPPFIDSFDILIPNIYHLDGFQVTKDLVREEFHAIAREVCKKITPQSIIGKLKNKLLICNEPEYNIYNIQLWTGFLEVLVLVKMHLPKGEEINVGYIDILNKKTMIVYGSVKKNWQESISLLYKTDLTNLIKGGCIYVVSSTDHKPTMTELRPNILKSIANVPARRIMVNNSEISEPFEDVKVKHIFDLQMKIINKNDLLCQVDAETVMETLENETRNIL